MQTNTIQPVLRLEETPSRRRDFTVFIPLVYPVIFFLVIAAAFAAGLMLAGGTINVRQLTILAFISHPVVVISLLSVSAILTITVAYYLFQNRRYPVLRMREMIRDIEKSRDDILKENRNIELARIELAHKANHMEMTNKFRSEFLANMSHELRTPLNSIIVLSQLMGENRKSNLTEKQIEYARTIFTSGNDLLELINEILDISKIESGKFDVLPERVLLKELVNELEQMFAPVARKKELNFFVEMQAGLPSAIFTDSKRLGQILRNLISNAIKFTPQGSVKLKVSVEGKGIENPGSGLLGNRIFFAVSDTGIGIPDDQLKAIFEPYRQADISTSRKFGGTGLGLTISWNLAQLLGGEIMVSSKEGEGSEFLLILPEKYLKDNISRTRSSAASHCEACNNLREINGLEEDLNRSPKYSCGFEDDRDNIKETDKSLLIIDDDPSFSEILSDLAKERGFKSIIAHNGECGLQCAHYFDPSAIILDICLPGINGWQVMEKLRVDPRLNKIPVFFISGADETHEVSRMGAAGFLSKPVNVDKIHDAFKLLEDIITSKRIQNGSSENIDPLFAGRTILLVDDDPFNMFAMRSLLEEKGLKVITAANGMDCLDKIQRYTEIDLVLMDFMMPGMDGCKVIRMIREMNQFDRLPVIAVTARAREEDKKICMEAGANGFLAKPVNSHKLFATLQTWLSMKIEEAAKPQL